MRKAAAVGSGRRRKVARVTLAVLSAGALIFGADYFAFPWGRPIGAPICDKGKNGLWIRYTYYFGEKSAGEVESLARRLRDGGFKDAYFHVRFIKRDGTLAYRYPERARELLSTVRRLAPSVRLSAWVFAGNAEGQGEVALSDPTVRKAMVAEATWLVTECGFDGVQWDYEMCRDGDEDLLRLLTETREALPAGAGLGVCAPVSYPGPVNCGWSEDYIGEVAKRCDQVAVMCYDTGFLTPRSYVWLTRKQVDVYSRSVGREGSFVIGVPTYEDGTASHNPRAENLRNALRGVRQGVLDSSSPANFDGIALFADYTTTTEEWRAYESDWLGR